MFGLLARLSQLDAGAEAAVRVIAAFDALVVGRASVESLVRSTATLAECAAGMTLPTGQSVQFSKDGRSLEPEHTPVESRDVVDVVGGLSVWLEHVEEHGPLLDLVLERFALAARVLSDPPRSISAADFADPALTELLIAENVSDEELARAVRLLGLDPSLPLKVAAVATAPDRDPGADAVALVARSQAPARAMRVATVGAIAAVILQPRAGLASVIDDLNAGLRNQGESVPNFSERDIRVGVGADVLPHRARESWVQARLALKFAVPGVGTEVVECRSLGALTLLADVPPEKLAANIDVVALEQLAKSGGGVQDLHAVEALCRTGSLRHAAAVLHMHHSSVAARIARAEQILGWDLGTPHGMLRARIATQARQLIKNVSLE